MYSIHSANNCSLSHLDALDFQEKYMYANLIPGWCAGAKVSGLSDNVIRVLKSDKPILTLVKNEARDVAVVSVNESEKELIAFLKKHKWKKAPWFKNSIHGGRRTCLYMKQVPSYVELQRMK